MADWREELLYGLVYRGGISPGPGAGPYRDHPDFRLSSGTRSRIYVDVKHVMCGPWMNDVLSGMEEALDASGWWDEVDEDRWDGVAGMGMGGALLCGGLSARGFGVTMLRERPRTHGIVEEVVNRPEGDSSGTSAARIVLVDDVATTGRTLARMRRVLSTPQVDIVGALVVVDREEGARELMESYRIPLRSLLTLDDVRKYR